MVEAQERQDPGIALGFPENPPDGDALKMRMKKPRGEPGDPFIEIAENDSRPFSPPLSKFHDRPTDGLDNGAPYKPSLSGD
jgi:hypothetical protein